MFFSLHILPTKFKLLQNQYVFTQLSYKNQGISKDPLTSPSSQLHNCQKMKFQW